MITRPLEEMPTQSLEEYLSELKRYLNAALNLDEVDVDAPRQLCDHIEGKIAELKQSLYPGQADFDRKTDRPTSYTIAETTWGTVRKSTLDAAERVWSNLSGRAQKFRRTTGFARTTEEASLRAQAALCRRLLRLWVEASLYRLRMVCNFEYLAISHLTDEIERINRKRISQMAGIIKDYRNKMKGWNKQVPRIGRIRLLAMWFEDADHLQLLSTALGPSSANSSDEPGWAQVAKYAKAQLHIESREMRRSIHLQRNNIPAYLYLTEQFVVTRHGTRIRRLVISAAVIVALSLLFYILDDLLAAAKNCGVAHLLSLGQYVSYTLTILTGVGALGASPCGPYTQAIATFESVTGYFALALVVTLIFGGLTLNGDV